MHPSAPFAIKRTLMLAELKTRLIFIDTEVFRSKNYQFGEHTLQKLEEHLTLDRLHLLLSSITVNEIRGQIRELSNDVHSKLKQFQKDAKFLRNAPDLPCFKVFEKVTVEQIYGSAIARFESFLANKHVEVVSFEGVEIEGVFDRYFAARAPFGSGKKKSEFPDAFSIEAVSRAAERRQHELCVISNDGDLKNYVQDSMRMHHLPTIEDLLDLVVRTEEILVKPADIGDKFIKDNIKDIEAHIIEKMEASEFYCASEDGDPYDINRIEIRSVEIVKSKILSASRDGATYEIEFSAIINADLEYVDYGNSYWDSEEKEYYYVAHNSFKRRHNERYKCYIEIDYSDGLPANAEIYEIEFESAVLELNDIDGEVIETMPNSDLWGE